MFVALITGTCSGIGLAAALRFARRGHQKQMKTPSQPEDVAAVIYEAVTTTEPRLRWLVGEDARRWDAGRRRLSDEEYVAGARPLPDQEYLDQLRRRFGFEWS